ncbi:hypothetical protein CFK39_06400 [Brachybacterium avium]|uniref:Gram-positive cocci surface proteins LPxTG domain-containing protein n=1 Tax=Brachybacterium avium TaxID=2017485 RepID=A0A220UBA5_9MICO|nr:hypothetical protein CFK39_06400 [Brachybacterium avium]
MSLDLGGGVSLPLISETDSGGLLEIGQVGAVTGFAEAGQPSTATAAAGAVGQDGAIAIDPTNGGDYGSATVDLTTLFDQAGLTPVTSGVIDDLQLEVGAAASRADIEGAEVSTDYVIVDGNLVVKSPLVSDLSAALDETVTGVGVAAKGIGGPDGVLGEAFAGLPEINVLLGSISFDGTEVNVDGLDTALEGLSASLLEGPIANENGVTLDLSTGEVIINLDQVVACNEPGSDLSSLAPNTQVLSAEFLECVTAADGLVADAVDDVLETVTTGVTEAINSADVTAVVAAKVKLLGAVAVPAEVRVSGTLGQFLGTTDGDPVVAISLLNPDGALNQLLNSLLSPVTSAVVGALQTVGDGAIDGLTRPVADIFGAAVDPVITSLAPTLQTVTSSVISLTINEQATTNSGLTVDGSPAADVSNGSEGLLDSESVTGSFTVSALTLGVLPGILTEGDAINVSLASSTVRAAVLAPVIEVDPGTVIDGGTTSVTGSGYPALTDIVVQLQDAAGDPVGDPVTVATDGDGAFTTDLTVPAETPAGDFQVVGTATTPAAESNSAPLAVVNEAATLSAAPASVNDGGTTTVTGADYPAATDVVIQLQDPEGTPVGEPMTVTTDETGAFTAELTVPVGTPAGDFQVVGTAVTDESATAPLAVTNDGTADNTADNTDVNTAENTDVNTADNAAENTGDNTEVNTDVNTAENTEVNTEVNAADNTGDNTEVNTDVNTADNAADNTEVNTEVNAADNTDVNTDVNTADNAAENTGDNTEVNTDVNTAENTEVNTGDNTEVNAADNTGVNTDVNTADNAAENTGDNTEVNTDVNTAENTEVNTGDNTEVNTEVNAADNTDVNTDVNTADNAADNTEVNTEVNAADNTDVNTDVNTADNAAENTGDNTEVNTDVNTAENTEVNTSDNTEVNTEVNAADNTGVNTDVNTADNAAENTGDNTEVNTDVNTAENTEVNTSDNTEVNTEVNAADNTGVNTDVNTADNAAENTGDNTEVNSEVNTADNTDVNSTENTADNTGDNTADNTAGAEIHLTPARAVQGVDDVLVLGTGYTADGTAEAYLKAVDGGVLAADGPFERGLVSTFAAIAVPGESIGTVDVDANGEITFRVNSSELDLGDYVVTVIDDEDPTLGDSESFTVVTDSAADNTADNTGENTAVNTADNVDDNAAENTADNTEVNTADNTAANTEVNTTDNVADNSEVNTAENTADNADVNTEVNTADNTADNAVEDPTVSVDPATVEDGATTTVTGEGYPADSEVTVQLVDPAGNPVGDPVIVTTDADGAFTADVTVPGGSAAGDYTVEAAAETGETATADLAVTNGADGNGDNGADNASDNAGDNTSDNGAVNPGGNTGGGSTGGNGSAGNGSGGSSNGGSSNSGPGAGNLAHTGAAGTAAMVGLAALLLIGGAAGVLHSRRSRS